MLLTIIILSVLLVVFIYTTFNLLRKNENLEGHLIDRDNFIIGLKNAVGFANNKLKEIDNKNTFKGDDEVGWFFKNLLYIQEILNNYINESGINKEGNSKEEKT